MTFTLIHVPPQKQVDELLEPTPSMMEERERVTHDAEERKRALAEHAAELVAADTERLLNPERF